jgi:hypothetical protein
MHITNPSRSVRALATGAALVTCSLASAGGPSPLLFSTLDAASGFASLGSTTGTFSYTGPSTTMDVPLAIGAGSGSGAAETYNSSGLFDRFQISINTTSNYTSGVAGMSFTVTFGNSVQFADLGLFTGFVSDWTLNGSGLAFGDTISAGTHTFVGSFLYSGTGNTYTVGFVLVQAPASAVPLPGAAGLAAIGLVGMSRRRRR